MLQGHIRWFLSHGPIPIQNNQSGRERERDRERDRGINQVVVVLRDELAGHWEMSTAAPTGTSDASLLFVRYYTEIGKEYVNLP